MPSDVTVIYDWIIQKLNLKPDHVLVLSEILKQTHLGKYPYKVNVQRLKKVTNLCKISIMLVIDCLEIVGALRHENFRAARGDGEIYTINLERLKWKLSPEDFKNVNFADQIWAGKHPWERRQIIEDFFIGNWGKDDRKIQNVPVAQVQLPTKQKSQITQFQNLDAQPVTTHLNQTQPEIPTQGQAQIKSDNVIATDYKTLLEMLQSDFFKSKPKSQKHFSNTDAEIKKIVDEELSKMPRREQGDSTAADAYKTKSGDSTAVLTTNKINMDAKKIREVIRAGLGDCDLEFAPIIEQWTIYRTNLGIKIPTVGEIKGTFAYVKKLANNHLDVAEFIVNRSIVNGWKNLIPTLPAEFENKIKTPGNTVQLSKIESVASALKHFDAAKKDDEKTLSSASDAVLRAINFKNLIDRYCPKNTAARGIINQIKHIQKSVAKSENVKTKTENTENSILVMETNTKILIQMVEKVYSPSALRVRSSGIKKLNELLKNYSPNDCANCVVKLKELGFKSRLCVSLISWAISRFYVPNKNTDDKKLKLFAGVFGFYMTCDYLSEVDEINKKMRIWAMTNQHRLTDELKQFLLIRNNRFSVVNNFLNESNLDMKDAFLSGNLDIFTKILDIFMCNTDENNKQKLQTRLNDEYNKSGRTPNTNKICGVDLWTTGNWQNNPCSVGNESFIN